jgi:translocation and assembly module TamA
MRTQVFLLLCFLFLFTAACGGKRTPPGPEKDFAGPSEGTRIVDPKGPIPAPSLPFGLAPAAPAAGSDARGASAAHAGGLRYTVVCAIGKADPQKGKENQEKDASAFVLVSDFEKTSALCRLADSPPETLVELERRLAASLREAEKILRGNGYYSGVVRGEIEHDASLPARAKVRVTFFPGVQYRLGKSTVIASLPASLERKFPAIPAGLPKTLADVGLAEGSPAVAAAVLAAVDRVRDQFPENGFPFASVRSTRYITDRSSKTLDAVIEINAGPFVRMGDVKRHGAPLVAENFIQALRKWRKGQPWKQSRVENFRDALRESGLFRSVDVTPAEKEDADGNRPVETVLASAPERTFGGFVKYHSDFGPGVQGNWEHRNLTGRGDRLRVAAPVWSDMQELTAGYRLPYFIRRDQDFLAGAAMLYQETDAYRQTSLNVSAGLERRLGRRWSASLQGSLEGGGNKEPDKSSRNYILYGIPLSFLYDGTGNLLDAASGQRLNVTLAPYAGKYGGQFAVLRSRVEGQTFLPLVGEDRLVLALRGVLGVAAGEDSEKIPPSARFYSGGGGSVRGYAFQSLGPRNEDDKPLGGGSLMEFSAENRWKVTPEWGIVSFLDGGGAYANTFDGLDRPIRLGAGIGVRYYTAVGPVRFDIATPLTPRKDDDPLQLYISIGQSF